MMPPAPANALTPRPIYPKPKKLGRSTKWLLRYIRSECDLAVDLGLQANWDTYVTYVHGLVAVHAMNDRYIDRDGYFTLNSVGRISDPIRHKVNSLVNDKFPQIRWFQNDWPTWQLATLQINAANANHKHAWRKEAKANAREVQQECTNILQGRLPLGRRKF